jgi:hypothetical protein
MKLGYCVDDLMNFHTGACLVERKEHDFCPRNHEKCAMWMGAPVKVGDADKIPAESKHDVEVLFEGHTTLNGTNVMFLVHRGPMNGGNASQVLAFSALMSRDVALALRDKLTAYLEKEEGG